MMEKPDLMFTDQTKLFAQSLISQNGVLLRKKLTGQDLRKIEGVLNVYLYLLVI